jgi:hypothetical protein
MIHTSPSLTASESPGLVRRAVVRLRLGVGVRLGARWGAGGLHPMGASERVRARSVAVAHRRDARIAQTIKGVGEASRADPRHARACLRHQQA